ncbi:MAG: ATP-dependent sacrificial sulfur transferase LarE [Desulfovibrionaceae bacterium]|nr:ATP-dependent sacrificial sulfur transferase LarE [Desulfovibrionaceae bacterium]
MIRFSRLVDAIRPLGRAVVAFSGGVDSSLVAAAGQQALGDNLLAVTVDTGLMSARELDRAGRVARSMDLAHEVRKADFLADPDIARNGPDRCYHCKRRMLTMLKGVAVLDGTNADDDPMRPGLRALGELGVRSPLAEIGLFKDDVRRLAAGLGLPSAAAPAQSCLATRVARGLALSPERLQRVERLEDLLRAEGLEGAKVRDEDTVMIVDMLSAGGDLDVSAKKRLIDSARRIGCPEVVIRGRGR